MPKSLENKHILITGACGQLGREHAKAVAQEGATPVLLDLDTQKLENLKEELQESFNNSPLTLTCDITSEVELANRANELVKQTGKLDGLINNAANNPHLNQEGQVIGSSRLENFSLDAWQADLSVGLTGSFLCTKHFGQLIAKNPNGGSIVNISSDLGIIGPKQNLYRKDHLPKEQQPVKPVTYSVVKTGLIGLTRYTATYWATDKVRCNALCPGGVYNNQLPDEFVKRLCEEIPLERMAEKDEYHGAIVFLCSDASRYMTGSVLSIDGGRTCW